MLIMGMTRTVWVGQARVWVGHGLSGLISRTASVSDDTKLFGAVDDDTHRLTPQRDLQRLCHSVV